MDRQQCCEQLADLFANLDDADRYRFIEAMTIAGDIPDEYRDEWTRAMASILFGDEDPAYFEELDEEDESEEKTKTDFDENDLNEFLDEEDEEEDEDELPPFGGFGAFGPFGPEN